VLRAIAAPLGARLAIGLDWHGTELRRLLDADHAELQAATRSLLERLGWLVRAEVTFNHFGERGSIELLAYHPHLRIVLVVEVKTAIVDVQRLLATLDMKRRLGIKVAGSVGWSATSAVSLLVIAEGTTNRRRLEANSVLFAEYEVRGRAAATWLRAPAHGVHGLLRLAKLPNARGSDRRRAGRQRIRLSTAEPRSTPDAIPQFRDLRDA
jgi:hypothetical protein